MKNRIFIEVFPFALLAAFFWFIYQMKDLMAAACLAVLFLIVLVQIGADVKNKNL